MESSARFSKGARMNIAEVQKFLHSLPHTTLSVQWGNDHVFKIAGKMYAVVGFDDAKKPAGMSFKATPESFRILTELPGIIPAPYLARAQWVYLDKPTRLPSKDLKAYLTRAHAIVAGGLTRKLQMELGLLAAEQKPTAKKRSKAKPKAKR
jgi:predicted DNA-binding protein (MmcQ/YjbR family)